MQRHALTDTVRTAQVARFVWSCSFSQMTHHLVYRENMANSVSPRRPSAFVRYSDLAFAKQCITILCVFLLFALARQTVVL